MDSSVGGAPAPESSFIFFDPETMSSIRNNNTAVWRRAIGGDACNTKQC